MKAIKVHAKLHWGFSIRKPFFSASQPTFKVPPPSTLIGALSRAYAYLEKLPETLVERLGKRIDYYSTSVKLLTTCKWASLALIDEHLLPKEGLVETQDIMRALIAPYLRRENIYPGSRMLYAPQAHGKVYFPDLDILITYLTDDAHADILRRTAWGITAIGCKESIACVVDVKVLNLSIREDEIITTRFYFESDLSKGIVEGDYIEDYLTIPSRDHFKLASTKYTLKAFIIPINNVRVRIDSEKAVVLHDGYDNYIIRKEVIS